MNTHAIILAAGIGTRLRPITKDKPKCLTAVLGKPILAWQIDAMRSSGVSRISLVVGYEASAIRSFVANTYAGLAIEIVENAEYEETNNLYSLSLALAGYCKGTALLVCNADVVFDSAIIARLVGAKDSAIAAQKNCYNHESMKIVVDDSGGIVDLAKTIPETLATATSIDVYFFRPNDAALWVDYVLRTIKQPFARTVWTEVALRQACVDKLLRLVPFYLQENERWYEIDTIGDLVSAELLFSQCVDKLKDVRTFLVDLDGTVFIGNTPVPGAVEALNHLADKQRDVIFITNNTSRSKSHYADRLREAGVRLADIKVLTPIDALLADLKERQITQIYLVGNSGLAKVLEDHGIEPCAAAPQCVVVAYDDQLTYEKLSQACLHIQHGVDLLATHTDCWCPTEKGKVPDAGAILEAINRVTGKSPSRVFGKPNLALLSDYPDLCAAPQRVGVVGDRMHTEMQLAERMGSLGVLVLTGETKREDLEHSYPNKMLVLPSIAELRDLVQLLAFYLMGVCA